MLNNLQQSVMALFLITSMAGIGLQVDWRDFIALSRHKKLLLPALAINFLIIPLLGWGVTRLIAMPPLNAEALIILSCAPGGLSAVQFTSKSKDALVFAGQTALLFVYLAIFISPLLISLFLPVGMHLIVPYGRVLAYVSFFLMLPLAIGLAVRHGNAKLAQRLARPTAFIGTASFVLFIILTLSLRRSVMAEIDHREVIGIIAFVLVMMVIGWLSGGPKRETRRVLAAASSMRNVALALAITTRSFPGTGIEVPLVAFFALMVTPNMLLVFILLGVSKFAKQAPPSGEN